MLARSRLARLVLPAIAATLAACASDGPSGPGPAARIALHGGNNQSAFAATAVAAPPAVIVTDAAGQPVPGVTVSFAVASGGGSITGATGSTDVNGIAAVGGWTMGTVAGANTLTATAAGLTGSPVTFTATATAAAPSTLVVTGPTTTTAGASLAPSIQVTVKDAYGNTVTTATNSINIAITGGTGVPGATLSGTLTQAAAGGIATFGNLAIDKAGSGYTLTISSSSLTSVITAPFDITVGAPAKLAFTVQPSGVTAGAAIGPAVQVTVQDAQGNTITGSAAAITLAVGAGTGTAGAILGGTLTRAAVSGVAGFNDLTLNKSGAGYTLTATATGLSFATSSSFGVSAGAPANVAFTTQPLTAIAGSAVSPAVQVTVQDVLGNTVTTSAAGVSLAITAGTGTAGATLSGTLTQAAVGGVASFGNLTLDKSGGGYTLTATATGLTSAMSAAFAVNPGAAAKLAFSAQPVTTSAGTAMAPAVQVTIQDALGNTVATSTAGVTVAITAGTGAAGAALGGTLARAAAGGVATFNDLTIDKVGSGYTLSATSPGLTSATSTTLAITAGAPAKLLFAVQPSAVVAGTAMSPSLQVTVQDALGNTVTTAAVNITVALTPGAGPVGRLPVLSGTLTRQSVAGTATFDDLSINVDGSGYSLTAASSGLTSVISATFSVATGAPSRLAFLGPIMGSAAGATMFTVAVAIQDAQGNIVTSSTVSVTIAITPGTGVGGAVLSGTLTRAAVAGVALFNDLSINLAGAGYSFTATAPGLTSATSNVFGVGP